MAVGGAAVRVIPRPRERAGAGTGKGASRPRTLGGAQTSGLGGGMYSEYTELTGRGDVWFVLSPGGLVERWAARCVLTGGCRLAIGVNLDAEVGWWWWWWWWRRYLERGRYGRQV